MNQAIDARIGKLSSGKFYAFANGYNADPVTGSLKEVEAALGLRTISAPVVTKRTERKVFDVIMAFQYPAWDETDGILFAGIEADSKSEANAIARRKADRDGHLCGGQGRVTFTARERE